MSLFQRGEEVTLTFNVDGVTQVGSFLKVKNFKVDPRQDIPEVPSLGEDEDDLDFQHHGFSFSFDVYNVDKAALLFLQKIVARELAHQEHPLILVTATHKYRNGTSATEHLHGDLKLKVNTHNMGGRKENVMTSFEGKCKKHDLT
jgi:hypothetical protein